MCRGSNTGQIANGVGVKLAQAGLGYLACLAGVEAGAENTLKRLSHARKMVAIDGCPVACAKGMLEKAGVKIDGYVQVMELGLAVKVEKVTDVGEIINYGVMLTPALVVDGQVVSSGRVPSREEIKQWLA